MFKMLKTNTFLKLTSNFSLMIKPAVSAYNVPGITQSGMYILFPKSPYTYTNLQNHTL